MKENRKNYIKILFIWKCKRVAYQQDSSCWHSLCCLLFHSWAPGLCDQAVQTLAKPFFILNKPEILYRPFISSNHYRTAMDMTMSSNFAISSTFIKHVTFYNVSEDVVEGLCIDPGFFPVDISRMKSTWVWYLCITLRFSKDHTCFFELSICSLNA